MKLFWGRGDIINRSLGQMSAHQELESFFQPSSSVGLNSVFPYTRMALLDDELERRKLFSGSLALMMSWKLIVFIKRIVSFMSDRLPIVEPQRRRIVGTVDDVIVRYFTTMINIAGGRTSSVNRTTSSLAVDAVLAVAETSAATGAAATDEKSIRRHRRPTFSVRVLPASDLKLGPRLLVATLLRLLLLLLSMFGSGRR